MPIVELVAAVSSAVAVWMTVKRHPWCWPVGLVSVLIYGWVFVGARLYSDALLQAVFGAMLVYGWWRWRQHLDTSGRVTLAALPLKSALGHLLVGAILALLLGYAMQRWTNAALPWLDATLAAYSLVGEWWQAKRHAAAWWMWIGVDVIYVGMYAYKDLYITALLYVGFVVLAVIGLRAWLRVEQNPPTAACGAVAPN